MHFDSVIIVQRENTMTSGIYQLNFNNHAYYIGQSVDMETRWKQHADKFRKGTAAQKMQQAYNQFGMPNARSLINCHRDYLDIMEGYYINIQRQFVGCLNTTAPPMDPNVDYQFLIDNPYLLETSSMAVLKEAIDLMSKHTKLQEEHADLKHSFNKEYLLHKAVAELKHGKDKNEQLVKDYYDKMRNAQEKVTRLLNRGIFDRLFNHQ